MESLANLGKREREKAAEAHGRRKEKEDKAEEAERVRMAYTEIITPPSLLIIASSLFPRLPKKKIEENGKGITPRRTVEWSRRMLRCDIVALLNFLKQISLTPLFLEFRCITAPTARLSHLFVVQNFFSWL